MSTAPTTVEEVLIQLGIQVASVSNNEIAASCPFHADSHPSFSANATTGAWICYQCGERGSLTTLMQKISGDPHANAGGYLREVRVKEFRQRRSVLAPNVAVEEPQESSILYARFEHFKCVPEWALESKLLDPVITDLYAIKWDKGFIIPIWGPDIDDDVTGLWGWQFKRLKFVSNYPPKVKKSQTLFGLREMTDDTRLVLVESPLDVVRLASVGVPAVASYGAFVSNTQLHLLLRIADRLILALDSDEEGQRQTERIYPMLTKFGARVTTVRLPDGAKDPGDLGDAQVEAVFGDV